MILWTGKLEKAEQLCNVFTTMIGRRSLQEERNGSGRGIVQSMLTNCFDMSVFDQFWMALHFWFCTQTCTSRHFMDSSFWQTLESFDLQHSNCEWLQTIWSCGDTTQQRRLTLFQDSNFAEKLVDSKSTSEWVQCIFGRRADVPWSCMCKKKKRTQISESWAASEVISLYAGLRMDCSRAWSLGYNFGSTAFF